VRTPHRLAAPRGPTIRHGPRAAGELGVTQTAVSEQVKLLEAFLGLRLIRRVRNFLDPTDRGAQYLPPLREAFASIGEETEALVRAGGLYARLAAPQSSEGAWPERAGTTLG